MPNRRVNEKTGVIASFERNYKNYPSARPQTVFGGKHLEASGKHLEASERHLRGIWEASGRRLGEIWEASGRHLGQRRPGRGSEGNCAKTYVFFCRKWRARPFSVHESDLTLTKSAGCAQKLASDRGGVASETLMDILT